MRRLLSAVLVLALTAASALLVRPRLPAAPAAASPPAQAAPTASVEVAAQGVKLTTAAAGR